MFYRTLKAVNFGIDLLAQGVGPFEDEQEIASWAIEQQENQKASHV